MSRVTEDLAGGFWLRDTGPRKTAEPVRRTSWHRRLLSPIALAAFVMLGCVAILMVSAAAAAGVDLGAEPEARE